MNSIDEYKEHFINFYNYHYFVGYPDFYFQINKIPRSYMIFSKYVIF